MNNAERIKKLQGLVSRHYHLIVMTFCIAGIGTLLRVLPIDFTLVKPFHLLELGLQDLRMEWRVIFYQRFHPLAEIDSPPDGSPIALILIHEREFQQYGFPPNRGAVAEVVDALAAHGAKIIAFDITFDLKQGDEARFAAASQRAGNVIYPMVMTYSENSSSAHDPLPPAVDAYLHPRTKGNCPFTGWHDAILFLASSGIGEMTPARFPLEPLLSSAAALGHITAQLDIDARIRHTPLVLKASDGVFYPSLSLMAVCLFQDIPPAGITIEWGKRVILDNQKRGKDQWRCEIPIDHEGQMRINYDRRLKAFPQHRFSDVHRAWQSIPGLDVQPIPLEDFRGKIVLIGYLEERSDQTATPFELKLPGLAVHATIVQNILQKNFVREASWWLDVLVLSLFTGAMVISQVYPRRLPERRPQVIYTRLTAIAVGMLLVFALINFVLFCIWGFFLNLVLPLVSMALGCFTALGYRYVTTTETFIQRLEQKQEALEYQTAYNELILEHMGNGLIVLNRNGETTTFNPKAAQIFNVNENQVLGKPIQEVFGRDCPELVDRLTKALGGAMGSADLEIGAKEFQVSLSYGTEIRGRRRCVIAAITDVTEVRDLERKIQLQQKQAAYSQLASELNHRMKNSLATLKLAMNQLMRRIESSESNKAVVERVSRQIDRLEQIGTDFKRGISTYNQVKQGRWGAANLNDMIQSVLANTARSINENIHVQTQLCEHLPSLKLEVDWMKDALQNLIHNAIDAMPQGGQLTITTEVLPTGQVRLTVGDTGEGIPDEDQPKIFTPWFTRKEEGSGMGLYMVQQVILAHDGEIEFESQEGKGTTFHLLFPNAGQRLSERSR
ncbi:CHASE2 domain-containing protein [Candidatus Poribacteria bacterium]|nr:CHASE2 domain-containing protein [Candidatus Poribacteria bacterium]